MILEKFAGGSLINARPLCPVDDASNRSLNATAWEFLLAWFWRFLEREEDLRVLTSWIYPCRIREVIFWILESERVDLLLASALKPPKKLMLFKKPFRLEFLQVPESSLLVIDSIGNYDSLNCLLNCLLLMRDHGCNYPLTSPTNLVGWLLSSGEAIKKALRETIISLRR